MKRITIFFGLLLIINIGNAQINSYVQYLMNNHSVDFELTIKRHAADEYRNNHPMLVIAMNEQAKSLFEVVEKYNFNNKEFLFEAIIEWTYDDYELRNSKLLSKLKQVSAPTLLVLHCDWVNVLDEYVSLSRKNRKK